MHSTYKQNISLQEHVRWATKNASDPPTSFWQEPSDGFTRRYQVVSHKYEICTCKNMVDGRRITPAIPTPPSDNGHQMALHGGTKWYCIKTKYEPARESLLGDEESQRSQHLLLATAIRCTYIHICACVYVCMYVYNLYFLSKPVAHAPTLSLSSFSLLGYLHGPQAAEMANQRGPWNSSWVLAGPVLLIFKDSGESWGVLGCSFGGQEGQEESREGA